MKRYTVTVRTGLLTESATCFYSAVSGGNGVVVILVILALFTADAYCWGWIVLHHNHCHTIPPAKQSELHPHCWTQHWSILMHSHSNEQDIDILIAFHCISGLLLCTVVVNVSDIFSYFSDSMFWTRLHVSGKIFSPCHPSTDWQNHFHSDHLHKVKKAISDWTECLTIYKTSLQLL
jgi:hypothetical protein